MYREGGRCKLGPSTARTIYYANIAEIPAQTGLSTLCVMARAVTFFKRPVLHKQTPSLYLSLSLSLSLCLPHPISLSLSLHVGLLLCIMLKRQKNRTSLWCCLHVKRSVLLSNHELKCEAIFTERSPNPANVTVQPDVLFFFSAFFLLIVGTSWLCDRLSSSFDVYGVLCVFELEAQEHKLEGEQEKAKREYSLRTYSTHKKHQNKTTTTTKPSAGTMTSYDSKMPTSAQLATSVAACTKL